MVHWIKNQAKDRAKMAIWSINNSQAKNYFLLQIWLEKGSLKIRLISSHN
jgi:hypothetical protein